MSAPEMMQPQIAGDDNHASEFVTLHQNAQSANFHHDPLLPIPQQFSPHHSPSAPQFLHLHLPRHFPQFFRAAAAWASSSALVLAPACLRRWITSFWFSCISAAAPKKGESLT